MEDLGSLGGGFSLGTGINEDGWVTGLTWDSNGARHGFLAKPGATMRDLGFGNGISINTRGVVAGVTGNGKPALFDGTNTLVIPSIWQSHNIGAVNDADVFGGIGASYGALGYSYVNFIASASEGLVDINAHLPPNATNVGFRFSDGFSINNLGQIVGGGAFNRRITAVLLDPIPPKLRATRVGNELEISWSPAWPGLILEASETLGADSWQSAATGKTNLFRTSASGANRFFRLNVAGAAGWCCAPQPTEPRNHSPFPVARIASPNPAAAWPVLYSVGWFLVISPDGARARVVFDGKAYDPDDDPVSVEWGEEVDGVFEVFGRSEVVTNVFERLGRHEVQFRASDGKVTATNTVKFEIITPIYMMTQLLAFLEQSSNLYADSGRFVALVRRALREFERGDYASAMKLMAQALQLAKDQPISSDGGENGGIQYLLQELIRAIERGITP
jgi:probable HAF family extracellular repeat protein